MGAAFYSSNQLAVEAADQYAQWYSDALKAPLKKGDFGGSMYFIKKGNLSLSILAADNTVRVSCEHGPTQSAAITEGLQRDGIRW